MSKKVKFKQNILLQSLEFIGKPLFLFFALIFTLIYSLGLFTANLLQSIKLPKFSIPKRSISIKTYPLLITFTVVGFGYIVYYFIFKDLPKVSQLTDSPISLTTKIYDRNGVLLYQIYKNENRSLIKLAELPPHLINATLTAEDKNFYHHFGFDLFGMIRAMIHNLENCTYGLDSCTLEGGSTITQQLVKNALLTSQKSLTRKLKELVLAIEAESKYSKNQILEMYFNQVPYGGTAYGIEEASESYFGKHAKDLNLAESALLAGLPVSPTTLSPYGVNPYLSKLRQHQILEKMRDDKLISEEALASAENTPLRFNPQGIAITAPHFVMYVRDLLVKKFGEDIVSRGGLKVTTTLDVNTQEILEKEIDLELLKLKNMHVSNAAGLVVSPKTGQILAMAGSHDFFDTEHDGQVNITLQSRQPGSSIKPITYTLALLRGLSPSSTIEDSPICFKSLGQPDYCPSNYDGRFHGTITLRTALGSSYNIPAIKLLNSLGVKNLVELARTLGITTWDDSSRFGLSLTLGGGEVTMVDLATVYGVFANGGYKVSLDPLLSVEDSSGGVLYAPSPTRDQVIPDSIAYQINSILSDNNARAPAFGANSILNIKHHQVAVKTGTTNNLRDNWTFGYTPDILVSTWVGNNDNTPMSSVASGITGASPIWSRTMTELLKSAPQTSFTPPPNIVKSIINCTQPKKYDYFVKGNEPHLDCSTQGTLLDQAIATSQ